MMGDVCFIHGPAYGRQDLCCLILRGMGKRIEMGGFFGGWGLRERGGGMEWWEKCVNSFFDKPLGICLDF